MIGVIADDFTGATDVAGLLARTGANVRLHAGLPQGAFKDDGAAVNVIALKCRTAPDNEAVADTTAALEWLLEGGATQIYWKYCSTFDSTAKGNIGPVAEALMARLDVSRTVHCPAFPENGRTVYQGHLFVGDQLLSESPMRHHPLTPMTDSSIRRLLAPQVAGKTGLVPLTDVGRGPARVREAAEQLTADGVAHLVVDAVYDGDLTILGKAFAGDPLLAGGSAFAAAAYGPDLLAATDGQPLPALPAGHAIILSGSCSAATREQVARYRANGGPVIDISANGSPDKSAVEIGDRVRSELGPHPLLVTSSATPDALEEARRTVGRDAAGAWIETQMANAARQARAAGATRFIVAGGETSGAVTMALGATRLRVGPEIAPGVPWCFAEDERGPFAIALKSGNFGSPDFFAQALTRLEELQACIS